MPFDNLPLLPLIHEGFKIVQDDIPPLATFYERLKIIADILPASNLYQGNWEHCLWSDIRRNKQLLALGLSGKASPTRYDGYLFGLYTGRTIFSGMDRNFKIAVCAETLQHMTTYHDYNFEGFHYL